MVLPTRLRYTITTKVTVLIKLNNMPLKALVTTPLTVATTLGTSGDISIGDTSLQLVTVGQLQEMVN